MMLEIHTAVTYSGHLHKNSTLMLLSCFAVAEKSLNLKPWSLVQGAERNFKENVQA
jgi:hypothetical protein